MKRRHASTLIGIIGIAAGQTILLALPIEEIDTIRRVKYWKIIADKLNSLNEAQL